MIKNYLKIALRNLMRHKSFSLINVSGLTIGLTCCFLIMVFVRHELSYDLFHKKQDRIYRLNYMPRFAGFDQYIALTPTVPATVLPDFFPEIEKTARIYQSSATIEAVSSGKERAKYDEERFFFADSSLLNIFSFEFIEGDPQTALRDKYSVVITDKTAEKYFGKASAIGKTLLYQGKDQLKVTGVIKELPDNSHIKIDLLSDYETMFATESAAVRANLPQNWVITHSYTYVLLRPGQSVEKVNARLPKFLLTHADKQLAKGIEYKLQPLSEIHLNPEIESNPEPGGSMTNIYVFLAIGAMTVVIACINFVNMSTARSLKRAREVGIRKTLGSEKGQIIAQFMGESLFLSGVALVLSSILAVLLLPVLNNLTGKYLTARYLFEHGELLIVFVGIAIFAGLLSGFYPAFFISRFQPVATLKGNFTSGNAKGGAVRQALLGFQFIASIVLIIGSLIAFRQLKFLMEQPMGFDKDYMITATVLNDKITNVFATRTDSSFQRLKTFREVIRQHAGVTDVTFSTQRMGTGAVRRNVVVEGRENENTLFIGAIGVDFNFAKTYGLKMIAGRDFSEVYTTDKAEAFLINEAGLKQLGWKSPGEAIGKGINLEGKKGRIVGVMKDFHNQSLQNPIESMLLTIDQPMLTQFSIKVHAKNIAGTLRFIESEWNRFFPEKSFTYEFLDQRIAQAYESEQRLSKMVGYFAGLAILISCLGLYGLVSLATQQKTKEIGIRKVLGASVGNIVSLLSRDFVILIGIAFVIASPLAWFAMDHWLQDFAYKTDVPWWIFAVAGILALLLTLATVSFQSIKAALMNPVKSLRSE